VIEYYFPPYGDENDTQEVFVGAAIDTILQPAVRLTYDFGEVHGFYGNVSIGHSITLDREERLSLDLGANVGFGNYKYNDEYFGDAENAFTDATVSAGLTYAVNKNLSVAWTLSHSELLDTQIRDNAKAAGVNPTNNTFIWDVTVSF